MLEKLFDTEPYYINDLGNLETGGYKNHGYDEYDHHTKIFGRYQISEGQWKQYMGNAPKTPQNQDKAMRLMTEHNYHLLCQKLGRIPTCAELASLHNLGTTGGQNAMDHLEKSTHRNEYGGREIDNDHYYQNLASAYLYKEGNTHIYTPQSQLPKDDEAVCEVTAPIPSMLSSQYTPQSLNPPLYGTPHPAHNPPPIPSLREQTPASRKPSHNTQQNQMGAPYAQQNTYTAFPSPFENVLNSHPAANQTPYVQAMSPFTENNPPFSATNSVTSQNIQQQNQIPNPLARSLGFKYLTDEYIHNSIRDFPLFNTNSPPK